MIDYRYKEETKALGINNRVIIPPLHSERKHEIMDCKAECSQYSEYKIQPGFQKLLQFTLSSTFSRCYRTE